MTVRILKGDVRAMLHTLEPESVHCVVTSVPYWGLRAYGTEPQVWGGEEGCEHEWGDHLGVRRSSAQQDNGPTGGVWSAESRGSEPSAKRTEFETSQGNFCRLCNAWRGEHGQEPTPEIYIANEVAIWREVRRVLRKDGVAWLNIGDSYAGYWGDKYAHKPFGEDRTADSSTVPNKPSLDFKTGNVKPKDLMLIPEQLAIALRKDGWWIRSRIPWVKRSAMPDSTTDRPGQAVEYFLMLTKAARYFFDMAAVRQAAKPESASRYSYKFNKLDDGGRRDNKRTGNIADVEFDGSRNLRNADLLFQSLEAPHGLISSAEGEPLALDVNTAGFSEAHFATFPPKLIEPLIKASTSERGCCVECGAPWVRVTEDIDQRHWTERRRTEPSSKVWAEGSGGTHGGTQFQPAGQKTLDWRPSCACPPAEPLQPCTVLDPFGGSGTTGLVADRLGRDAVLIELNLEYAGMAEQRIKGDAPLFTEVT